MALAPSVRSADFDKPFDPNTFAFFSDAHIAADSAAEHGGVNMSQNLASCTRALADWPVRPATIIVNGDLAYLTGKSEDYATFANLIEPLRAMAPIHLSLGNHDQRDHFWAAFPNDSAEQRSALQRQTGIVTGQNANWFLLDSLERTDKASGELGPAQLKWLARELDARADKPAIIVVHHNPQFSPMIKTGLSDTRELMEVIVPRRQVKLTVFGHTHDWRVSQHESGIHLVNLPPTAYVFIAGRPSGWVRATLSLDGAEFELRALDRKHAEHGQIHALKWRDA
jgi:3',5'-cyclic AMP phosphodiesterase CpdA